MTPTLKFVRRFPLLRGLLAVLGVGSVALAVLMAASPSLHHLVHHDAEEADHHCVVTLLAREHVLPLDITPEFVTPLRARMVEVAGDARVGFRSIQFLLPPGRGPPALS